MKKTIATLALLGSIAGTAQTISNPGFENWNPMQTYAPDTVPQQWSAYYCGTVVRTTDAIEGSYAARITPVLSCGIAPGMLVNGSMPVWGNIIAAGTPFTAKPASISAYYKMENAQPGDSAEATIILKKWNPLLLRADTIAIGYVALPPAAVYTLFTVNITDLHPQVMPDSIVMAFNASKYNLIDFNTMVLPSLFIDKIKLPDAATGISETAITTLVRTYPNPFTTELQLELDPAIGSLEDVSVQLFDVTGKTVRKIETVSSDNITIQRGDLAAGTYTYRVMRAGYSLAAGQVIAK